MNYLLEIKAFYDWLETNKLPTSAIVLWHALMHTANKTGWKESFTVAMSVLEMRTGLRRQTLYDARNKLLQSGRIEFRSRRGNQAAVYHIVPLVSEDGTRGETKTAMKSATKEATKGTTKEAAITKRDKTKPDIEEGGTAEAELPLCDGTAYGVTAGQAAEWASLYPAVDVRQQLRNMRGWLEANPTRRKTRRGILRFICGWLSREQDKGRPPVLPYTDGGEAACEDPEEGPVRPAVPEDDHPVVFKPGMDWRELLL